MFIIRLIILIIIRLRSITFLLRTLLPRSIVTLMLFFLIIIIIIIVLLGIMFSTIFVLLFSLFLIRLLIMLTFPYDCAHYY